MHCCQINCCHFRCHPLGVKVRNADQQHEKRVEVTFKNPLSIWWVYKKLFLKIRESNPSFLILSFSLDPTCILICQACKDLWRECFPRMRILIRRLQKEVWQTTVTSKSWMTNKEFLHQDQPVNSKMSLDDRIRDSAEWQRQKIFPQSGDECHQQSEKFHIVSSSSAGVTVAFVSH